MNQLDTFETALLNELRDVVAAQDLRLRRRPRLRSVAAAAVVAASAAAFAILPGLTSHPAFSVQVGNAGEIRIHVSRLDGASALESALAEHGINADITYLPSGEQCAPGRYVDAHDQGISLEIGADDFTVTLAAGTIAPGETFVLAASVTPMPDGVGAWVRADVVPGAVAACRPTVDDRSPSGGSS